MKVIPNLLFGLLLGAIIFTGSVAHLAVGKKKAKDKQSEAAKPDFQEVFKKLDAGARAAMKKDPKEGLNEVERVGRLLIKDYPAEPATRKRRSLFSMNWRRPRVLIPKLPKYWVEPRAS